MDEYPAFAHFGQPQLVARRGTQQPDETLLLLVAVDVREPTFERSKHFSQLACGWHRSTGNVDVLVALDLRPKPHVPRCFRVQPNPHETTVIRAEVHTHPISQCQGVYLDELAEIRRRHLLHDEPGVPRHGWSLRHRGRRALARIEPATMGYHRDVTRVRLVNSGVLEQRTEVLLGVSSSAVPWLLPGTGSSNAPKEEPDRFSNFPWQIVHRIRHEHTFEPPMGCRVE
jgi:hypothetical protein